MNDGKWPKSAQQRTVLSRALTIPVLSEQGCIL
jgi:hypothetical protein